MLTKNSAYEVMLAKAAGRSPKDHPDMLVDDLQDGRLPDTCWKLLIAKERGNCKDFVLACLMRNKGDSDFIAQFGTLSQISVGKIASLSTAYPALKCNVTSWK